jgi:hypothetical protein
MGFFIRAAIRENAGRGQFSISDAEQAYHRFEVAGDHWGMGMAAQAAGHLDNVGGDELAGEWLRRSEQHLDLVGAARDARSIRVLLDVQLAMAGDAEAEQRLREVAVSDEVDEMDTCQANLGLALIAYQRGLYDQTLAYADATIRASAAFALRGPPQPRIMFQVAIAVLHLRVAEARHTPGSTAAADARATEVLRQAREDVNSVYDSPLMGAWALGGAELNAFRGEAEAARLLWALGMRAGANISRLFPQGRGERLAAALGTEEDREPLLATARNTPILQVNAQIRELMDRLLD